MYYGRPAALAAAALRLVQPDAGLGAPDTRLTETGAKAVVQALRGRAAVVAETPLKL